MKQNRHIKVVIIATHPIQYHIPWFRLLSSHEHINLKVYFAMIPDQNQQGVGFDIPFFWNIPIMEGYDWQVLYNSTSNPNLNGFFSSSIPGIFYVLKKSKPDVVILTGWQSFSLIQALVTSEILRIPRIIRGESNGFKKRPWWVAIIHRLLLKQFNAFLAIGNANKDFYLNNGIKQNNIFSCPYFVDNDHFKNQYNFTFSKRNVLRLKWKIPLNHTCFLYVGKLVPKKCIMDLLQALDQVLTIRKDIHLLVVGSGELMNDAQEYVRARNLPVTFTGFLNQMELPEAYVVGDCIVLPSDFGETWGLVVNEAMVCGIPAIVSNRVGCGPDLIIEGATGYTYSFGNIRTLAYNMMKMASNPDKQKEMGVRAQKWVLKNYSVEKAVDGTLKAIKFVTSLRDGSK
jgi:glycosyltransferase involved in cell wall biosynthesis